MGVRLADGKCLTSKHGVIIATEGVEAWNLLGEQQHGNILEATPSIWKPPRSTVCMYFETDEDRNRKLSAKETEPIIILNGSGKGIINNMYFPTSVSRTYAPTGKVLVAISLVGLYEEMTD